MSFDLYSDVFKNLLLRNVVIKYGEKVYKTGKIQNFDIKQFYIKLLLENHKKQIKLIELPYPFSIEYTDECTTLNYHLTSFCSKDSEMYEDIARCGKGEVGKFYDNLVKISIVE
jgi:hypothetical protein